jgi:hypothetical protein
VSVGKVIDVFRKNRTQMVHFADDLETIRQRGGKAASGLVQSLLAMGDQGVGVAHSIAAANDQQFGKVVRTWSDVESKANSFAKEIGQEMSGAMDRMAAAALVASGKVGSMAAGLLIVEGRAANAAQAMAILAEKINGIPKDVNVTVHTHYTQSGPPIHGGIAN